MRMLSVTSLKSATGLMGSLNQATSRFLAKLAVGIAQPVGQTLQARSVHSSSSWQWRRQLPQYAFVSARTHLPSHTRFGGVTHTAGSPAAPPAVGAPAVAGAPEPAFGPAP